MDSLSFHNMPTINPRSLAALSTVPSALLLNVAQHIIGNGCSLNGCGTVILHTIGTLFDNKMDPASVTAFHRYVLKGIWTFLLTPRTEDEIAKLDAQLTGTCCCASLPAPLCNTVGGILHYLPEGFTTPRDFKVVISMFACAIDNYAITFESIGTKPGQMLSLKIPYRRAQGELRNFARSLDELIPLAPGGIDQAVEALWGWLTLPSKTLPDRIHYHVLLTCLTYLTYFCRGHISPAIVSRPKLMDDIVEALRSAVEDAKENATPNTLSQVADFAYSIVEFLYALEHSSFDVEFRMFAKVEHMFQLTEQSQNLKDLCLAYSRPPSGEQAPDGFSLFEQRMSTSEPAQDATVPIIPELKLVFMHAVADALALDRGGRCAAPECINTHAAANYKFQRCRGCGQSAYCSEACQRHAWSHSIVPHKMVCSLLSDFKGIVASVMSSDSEWSDADAIRKATIKDFVHQKALISSYKISKSGLHALASDPEKLGITRAVSAHYGELKKIKIAFLCKLTFPAWVALTHVCFQIRAESNKYLPSLFLTKFLNMKMHKFQLTVAPVEQ